MDIIEIRDYCMSKPNVSESLPFDEDTLVFKVNGKMFALTNLTGNLSLNLKCDPEVAIELRETYTVVEPGYHMNKVHWNTIMIDGSISSYLIKKWIDDSYELVTKGKKRKYE